MRMFPEIFEIGIFWGMYINNTTFVPLYTVQLLFIMKIQHVFAPLLRVQDVYRIAYLDFLLFAYCLYASISDIGLI